MLPPEAGLIKAWDHAGLRVHSLDRSMGFYEKLGFRLELDLGDDRAYEIINADGVRLNLIVNASYDAGGSNIHHDGDVLHPGITHCAFIVGDLDFLMRLLEAEGIAVTEGPKMVDRRRYLFVRDPDGNVLEFNQLLSE